MILWLTVPAAVLAAYGIWTLAGETDLTALKSRASAADTRNLELWLLGNPMPLWSLPVLQVVAAVLVAALAQAVSGNLVIALLVATLGWHAPGALLATLAQRVWHRADDQAHTLANILQFALPVQGNAYAALRHAIPDLDQPLRGWLEEVVASEAVGKPLEEGLAGLAARLRHQELALLAAILRSDRRAAPSVRLLPELLAGWQSRVRAAAERRTIMHTSQVMGLLFVWGPLAAFGLVDWLTPVGVTFRGSLLGQAIAAAGVGILVAAAHIQRSAVTRERRTQTE